MHRLRDCSLVCVRAFVRVVERSFLQSISSIAALRKRSFPSLKNLLYLSISFALQLLTFLSASNSSFRGDLSLSVASISFKLLISRLFISFSRSRIWIQACALNLLLDISLTICISKHLTVVRVGRFEKVGLGLKGSSWTMIDSENLLSYTAGWLGLLRLIAYFCDFYPLGNGLVQFSLRVFSGLFSASLEAGVFFLANLDFSSSRQFLVVAYSLFQGFFLLLWRSRMQIIAVISDYYSLNTNRIEMMSSSMGMKEDLNSKSAASLTLKDKRERLLKIEQKLEAITVHKQNQVRDQTEEELTRRVLDAELRCAQEIKSMQGKMRELKEGFAEMKIREGQLVKKCQLSRRNRAAELRDLQKRLHSYISAECKERKDLENSLISIMENKDKELSLELARVKEARIEVFNRFEGGLSEDLPELGVRIQQRLGDIEEKLQILHQQVRKEADALKDRIDEKQQERQKGMRSVYDMIGKLAQEIKNDMIEERKQRQTSRLKLLALFQTACGKLNLI